MSGSSLLDMSWPISPARDGWRLPPRRSGGSGYSPAYSPPTGAWDWERPAAAFPEGAEELDLLADEAELEKDIVYPGQQPWLNWQ